MRIALVMDSGESAALARQLATHNSDETEMERWIIEPAVEVAEQVLEALADQWRQTPADILIFPPTMLGEELATRLAWRLHGASVCQALALDVQAQQVTKSHWGNALTATLRVVARPLCISLARAAGSRRRDDFPAGLAERRIASGALPDWLLSVESVERAQRHPLLEAGRVLVVGAGNADVDANKIETLARGLHAEAGYSRARVMNGGYDPERLIGISGHLLSPDVCIVAGASGAAALMAGVRESAFIVAINQDADAPVFAQADVGVVDDWLPVLEALVACAKG